MTSDVPLNDEVKEQFLDHFLQNALRNKKIHLTDDDENNRNIVKDYIESFIRSGTEIAIVVDYRTDLLKRARLEKRRSNWETAALFYATFIEHSLNDLIITECSRRYIDERNANQIIREININAKMTWLLQLLGLKTIKEEHRNVLKRACDVRNTFVHYKWKPQNEEATARESIENIEPSIRYLKKYIENHAFGTQLRNLRRQI